MTKAAAKALATLARELAKTAHRSRITDIKQIPQLIASALIETRSTCEAMEALDLLDRSCQREYDKLLALTEDE